MHAQAGWVWCRSNVAKIFAMKWSLSYDHSSGACVQTENAIDVFHSECEASESSCKRREQGEKTKRKWGRGWHHANEDAVN